MTDLLTISPSVARRLALTRQHLAGPPPPATGAGIMQVVRALGCLQLDPISAVERSHRLVLWSRLGCYDLAELDRLLWEERRLFEYWAHVASIVLTEDYPIHNLLMRQYATGPARSARARKLRQWLKANAGLRRHILSQLRHHGPQPARYFEDGSRADWYSNGWTSGRNVTEMIDYLWTKGRLMVAGRQGLQKLWDLAERVLPDWAPRDRLSEREVVRRAAQQSLRALGVATAADIRQHFIRGRYPGLDQALSQLEAQGRIVRVVIQDGRARWPGAWYLHVDDRPLLQRLHDGDWRPRTTLLSPFDNLICDRARTRRLFGFDFTVEIYVPKAKRKYGYYVLPILHGERLIGRLDPLMDRERGVLNIHAVYAEAQAPPRAGRAVAAAVEDLAAFLGAREVHYNSRRVPAKWRRALLS